MINQFKIFLAALGFFTRIPVPSSISSNEIFLGKVYLFSPYVGIIVGVLTAFSFLVLNMFLPVVVSVIGSVICSVLLTGAFHEDGLADVCDGFGGGWRREDILRIMKDSVIGTYGAAGLFLALLLKISLLFSLPSELIPLGIFSAHILSRSVAISFTYKMNYARSDDSKTGSALMSVSFLQMILILLPGMLSLLIFNNLYVLVSFGLLLVFVLYFRGYIIKQINGYTGDCLGAVQQLSEILIYLSLVVLSYNNLSHLIF